MVDFANIPGGASTQIANISGNPEAVGLTPPQTAQAESAYMQSIARGPDQLRSQQDLAQQEAIPTGLEDGFPSEAPQEPVQEPTETLDVTLPSGEIIEVVMPRGMSDEEIRYKLIDAGEQGFTPDGSVLDRAMYGFGAGENITTNVGRWAKSHFPFLANEYYWGEGGLQIRDYNDIYGEGFDQLSPQAKRMKMEEVENQQLAEAYPEVHPKNLGTAGTVGGVAKAIADPAILLPGGQVAKGAKTLSAMTKGGAAVGGTWGGAYGLSEVAADKGIPTSLAELEAAAPQVLEPMAWGVAGGAVLGATAHGVKQVFTNTKAHKASLNPETSLSFTREQYWPKFWQLQMEGKSSGEASTILRKKMNMSLDDEWRLRQSLVDVDDGYKMARGDDMVIQESNAQRQGTAIYSPATSPKDAAQRFSEAKMGGWGDPILHGRRQTVVDDFLRPIAGVVKDISPRVYKRLIDMEGNVLRKTKEYHVQFKSFMTGTRKLQKIATEKDMHRFSAFLYNNRPDEAKRIWLQYGLDQEAFDGMRQGLTRLSKELKDAGVDAGYLEGYFPRIVKDYAGFRKYTRQSPELKGLEKRLRDVELKKGRKLTEAEQTNVINNYMAPKAKPHDKKTIGSAQKRTVNKVTDGMLPFYQDPSTALEYHLREALSKAERSKFFGKHMSMKDGIDDLTESVGSLVRSEGLTSEQTSRLSEVLNSRFGAGEQTGGKFRNSLRQFTGGITLGNPISALRQLGDIPSVMKTQGVTHTLAAMFKKADPEINADAMGYMLEMAQELDAKGAGAKTRALSQWLYRVGGFRKVDRFGKNTLIKAGFNNLINSQKTPKSRIEFVKKYGDIYTPNELAQLMDDAANSRVTDLLKSHLNAELMRVQPISRSQMPKKYLDMPNGRMFWQFRTWGLNQLELFRQDVWRGLKSKNPAERRRAARQGVAWMAGIGATNATITQGQRLLTKRDGIHQDEVSDEIIWQTLGNFGLFNRYGIERALQSGDVGEYLNTSIPPSLTIPGNLGLKALLLVTGQTEGGKDEMRDVVKQTGLGRIVDWTMLGGAEEYNDKRRKERATELNKILKGSAYAQ